MADIELVQDFRTLKLAIPQIMRNPTVSVYVAEAIELARNWINLNVRHRLMDTHVDGTATDGFEPLPNDFQEAYELTLTTTGYAPIQFVGGEEAKLIRSLPDGDTRVRWWTIHGDNIEFIPAPDEDHPVDYRLRYRGIAQEMAEDGDNNPLLTHYPRLWITAVCTEVAIFLQNDTAQARWQGERDKIAASLRTDNTRSKLPSGGLVVRSRVRFY